MLFQGYFDLRVAANLLEDQSSLGFFRPRFRGRFLLQNLDEIDCLLDPMFRSPKIPGLLVGWFRTKLLQIQVFILDYNGVSSVFAFFLGRVPWPLVEGVKLFNDSLKPVSNLGLGLDVLRGLLRGELGFWVLLSRFRFSNRGYAFPTPQVWVDRDTMDTSVQFWARVGALLGFRLEILLWFRLWIRVLGMVVQVFGLLCLLKLLIQLDSF